MTVVLALDRRVDAGHERSLVDLAVGATDDEGHRGLRLDRAGEAFEVEGLGAVELVGSGVLAVGELEGQHAHADEVGAVDALEGLRDHGLDAEEGGALRGPVAGRAHAVVDAAEDDHALAALRVGLAGVVDGLDLAVGLDLGEAAFLAVGHAVLDLRVGEGAARHDAVVAAARTVGVEVLLGDAGGEQELAGRGGLGERARGRDVVGGDGVAEERQGAQLGEGRHRRGRHREALEERGLLDVGGRFLPAEARARAALDAFPLGGGVGEGVGGVLRLEHRGLEAAGDVVGDLRLGGPDILEEDRFPVVCKRGVIVTSRTNTFEVFYTIHFRVMTYTRLFNLKSICQILTQLSSRLNLLRSVRLPKIIVSPFFFVNLLIINTSFPVNIMIG